MGFEHPAWLTTATLGDDSADAEPYPLRWLALVPITLAILLIGIDVSVVGVAVPSFTADLNASTADVQWIIDGFTIALGGFVVLGGGLADRYGRKGIFQIGMALFAVGCLTAAAGTTPPTVVVGRFVTGLGAAFVMPAALSLLTVIFPPAERPKAVAIFAAVSALGIGIGPVIGGVLLEHYWFGSVFLVNVPIALIAIAVAALTVPTSRRPGNVPLDVVAAILSVFGLGGLVAAIIEAPNRGLTNPAVLFALVVGAGCTAAFIWRELRSPQPLYDLRVFRLPPLVAGALVMAITYFTYCGTETLLVPQYLQYVTDYSTLVTGLLLLPVGIIIGVMSLISARLVDRFGAPRVLTSGLAAMTIGLGIFALLHWWGGYANVFVGIVVFFVGVGSVIAPATSQIMGAVPVEKAGDGSATNQVSRQVGGAFGIAVSGSVFAAIYSSRLDAAASGLSPADLAAADASLGQALTVTAGLPASQSSAAQQAVIDAATAGMSLTFVMAAAACAVVLLAVSRILRER